MSTRLTSISQAALDQVAAIYNEGRREHGKGTLSDEIAAQIAAIYRDGRRENGKRVMHREDAKRIAAAPASQEARP